MSQLFVNNFSSTVADNPLGSGATTIDLNPGDGAKLPAIVNAGDFYLLTLATPTAPETAWEIVKVTARATDALTVVRGQEGTTAVSWAQGTRIEGRSTRDTMYSTMRQNTVLAAAEPGAPSATDLLVYPRRVARPLLCVQGAENRPYGLQPSLAFVQPSLYVPNYGSTGVGQLGDGGISVDQASQASYTVATTDYVASQSGLTLTSAVTASAACGVRGGTSNLRFWRGNAAGLGGFFGHIRLVIGTLASDQRLFAGFTTVTGAMGADPSTTGDLVGVGADAADANLQLLTRDGTTANKIDLGVKKDTVNKPNQLLDIWLYCAPNDTTIYATVDSWSASTRTRLVDNQALNTNLPRNTQLMKLVAQLGNTATDTTAVVMRFCGAYGEATC